jgi:hypothetical protein
MSYVSLLKAAKDQRDASGTGTSRDEISANVDLAAQFETQPVTRLLRACGFSAFNGHPIFTHDMLINCDGMIRPSGLKACRSKCWAAPSGLRVYVNAGSRPTQRVQ